MRVIQGALALALVTAAAIGVRTLSGDPEPRPIPEPSPPVAAASENPDAPAVAAPAPGELAPADEPTPQPTPAPELDARLVGIVGSSAFFETADGARQVLGVGDAVGTVGSYRLEEIRRTSVVVSDGRGRSKELSLAGGSGGGADGPGSSPDLFAMDRLELEALGRGDPPQLAVSLNTAMRDLEQNLQLALDAEGAVSIDELGRGSPLARLGLRPGDRILSVDGSAVGSIQSGMDSLARSLYSEGGSTVIEVERFDGSRVQIAVAGGGGVRAAPR